MSLPVWCLTLIAAISLAPSIGAARAGCPTPAPSSALRAAFPSPGPLPPKVSLTAALEAPIWRTITIGEYKGVNAVRNAIDASPCSIGLGESADEILGRPAFLYAKKRTQLDLTVVSVSNLGFFDDGATVQEIYARALRIGLELCPAEVGPILRLNYLDQPVGEFLKIAMRPIARYDGELIDLSLGNGGAGLLLIGGDGEPGLVLAGRIRFVFVRPRNGDQPLPDGELVKR
jgi:hypothetical protein